MTKEEKRKFYSTAEVAEITGLSRRTIVNLCRSGELPCEKLGRTWLVKKAAIDRMVSEETDGT